MTLTKDERAQIADGINVLKSRFHQRFETIVGEEVVPVDSKFVRLLREKYLTEPGLDDLVLDSWLAADQGCTCGQTCVAPCASVCYTGRSSQ